MIRGTRLRDTKGSDSLKVGPTCRGSMTQSSASYRTFGGMPRPPRAVLPGHVLHVLQRGNNRIRCFVDDRDRLRFLAVLQYVSERAGCAIHAYVLMTNHTHLLVSAREARSPARMMQALGRRYVRYFNDRHGRTGTLWEGRYRSTLIDSERYFLQCSRYIEMNPVRAGLVSSAGDYLWSSFRSNAEGQPDPLLRQHPVYLALGQAVETRRDVYRALFSSPLESRELDVIRRATNHGLVLGFDDRRAELERRLRRRLARSRHGGDRRSPRSRGQTR